MARLAETDEVGQILPIFDDRDAGVCDPDPVDAVHVHTEGVSDEDFHYDIVGTHEDGLVLVGNGDHLEKIERALQNVREALAAGHLRARGVFAPFAQTVGVLRGDLVGVLTLPLAVVNLE